MRRIDWLDMAGGVARGAAKGEEVVSASGGEDQAGAYGMEAGDAALECLVFGRQSCRVGRYL